MLLIVEKQENLVSLNTNKPNQLLTDLEKGKTSLVIEFIADSNIIESQSKNEFFLMLGVTKAAKKRQVNIPDMSYCFLTVKNGFYLHSEYNA